MSELTPTMVEVMLKAQEKDQARSETARSLINNHHFATLRDTEEIYHYMNGYYNNGGDRYVKEYIRELWGDGCTIHDMSEIIKAHVMPLTYTDRDTFNTNINKTCLSNGVLDLKTGELNPHKPEDKFTFQLPIEYNPDATCPNIDEFLMQVTECGEDVETLLDLPAYCMHRDYPTAKSFILLGAGRNGKTVYINLIKEFLGEENVRGLSMHQLEHDQYALGFLFGKHANMNPDIGNKKIHTSGAIKKLTGNDIIDTNVKHRPFFKYKNFAKLIFACNELPKTDDNSFAWTERWIFITFPHIFNYEECPKCEITHEVDTKLIGKLTTPEELSGLLNRVIERYRLLEENDWRFKLSDSAKRIEKEYASLSDIVKQFIEECVIVDKESWVSKGDVYDAFREFCIDFGEDKREIPKSNAFTQRLKQHILSLKEARDGQKRKWLGIGLINQKDNEMGGTISQRLV